MKKANVKEQKPSLSDVSVNCDDDDNNDDGNNNNVPLVLPQASQPEQEFSDLKTEPNILERLPLTDTKNDTKKVEALCGFLDKDPTPKEIEFFH